MTFSLNAVDDPNLPSLPYQARERVPIHLPWGRKVIALGTGFDCDAKPGGAIRPSALALGQSKGQCALEAWTGSNSFRESTSAQAATSYEHMDFKGSMSMGGSVLGAEGRGAFANDVYRNQDVCTLAQCCHHLALFLSSFPDEQNIHPGLTSYRNGHTGDFTCAFAPFPRFAQVISVRFPPQSRGLFCRWLLCRRRHFIVSVIILLYRCKIRDEVYPDQSQISGDVKDRVRRPHQHTFGQISL